MLRNADPLTEAIRILLYMEWDPLGMQRSNEAWSGQYDVYVATVVRQALAGASAENIAAYLDFVESGLMSRLTPAGTTLVVADRVLKLAAAARRA